MDAERPSAPGPRRTYPVSASRSSSRTVPDEVRPSTCRSRSTDGRSRKCRRAASAAGAESARPAAAAVASPIWSATTSARAPNTFAGRSRLACSVKLVVETEAPWRGGRRHCLARARQAGQAAGPRALDDLPARARLAVDEVAISTEHEASVYARDLALDALEPGVHGRAVRPVAHNSVPPCLAGNVARHAEGDSCPR